MESSVFEKVMADCLYPGLTVEVQKLLVEFLQGIGEVISSFSHCLRVGVTDFFRFLPFKTKSFWIQLGYVKISLVPSCLLWIQILRFLFAAFRPAQQPKKTFRVHSKPSMSKSGKILMKQFGSCVIWKFAIRFPVCETLIGFQLL